MHAHEDERPEDLVDPMQIAWRAGVSRRTMRRRIEEAGIPEYQALDRRKRLVSASLLAAALAPRLVRPGEERAA